ncbi:MAG: hypothetical protein L6V93_08900 [Clostridiales bacterium]|nr:MAG: hypothetical protein L6V93_08900 [Clostridiales bacterium]
MEKAAKVFAFSSEKKSTVRLIFDDKTSYILGAPEIIMVTIIPHLRKR